MPQFSQCCRGADDYVCQVCGRIKCSACAPSVWRPDISGNKSAGNVCPDCLKKHNKLDGVFCENCGEQMTEREYSRGECNHCKGDVVPEEELR